MTRTRASRTLALSVLVLCFAAGEASATERSTSEVVQFAQSGDRDHLAEVTSIDGQPVELASYLEGSPADVEARMDELAKSLWPNLVDERDGLPTAPDLRGQAQEILAQSRYRARTFPQPLRRPLRWLGDQIGRIGHPVSSALEHRWLRDLMIAVVLAVAAAVAATLGRRRQRLNMAAADDLAGNGRGPRRPSIHDLERLAEAAQGAGRFDEALRLRFEAGVQTVARRVGETAPDVAQTEELRRKIASPIFDQLAQRHGEVAYGSMPATEDDVTAARRDWPLVAKAGS